MSRLPIRVRLALVFGLVMAIVFAGVGAVLYVRLGSTLDERIEDTLDGRATALAAWVRDDGETELDTGLIAGEEGVAQVIGPDGTLVASSPSVGDRVLLSSGELAAARDGSIRVERDELTMRAEPVSGHVVVVGELLEDRDDALDGLLAQLAIVLPIAVLLTSGIGYLVAGAALRPVEAMRVRADEISADTAGRRLPLPAAHDEVYRLGETLNEMLARLDEGLARERRFVADASHELRTPLATLRTELELARRRPRSTRELQLTLVSVGEEVERLVHLAEDLLVLARSDEGRLLLRVERHDARAVLDAVAGRYDTRARETGRTIEVSVAGEPTSTGDRLRLEQALGNLVDNALRHGAGTIRLDGRSESGRLVLSVSDEGDGFPADFLPHAFERFSRADVARSGGGVGLGLAIVAAIARAHDGTATAVNRPEGGAVVTVVLPVDASTSARLLNEHAVE